MRTAILLAAAMICETIWKLNHKLHPDIIPWDLPPLISWIIGIGLTLAMAFDMFELMRKVNK